MGLVQNLKKKFNNWVDRTLAELCSAYIKQLAKQTSRKRDNSLLTESSPSLLTTERQSTTIVTSSQDTSEKIIMKLDDTDKIVAHNREWAINKVESAELVGDKIAIYAEFEDWIEIDDVDNIEIISIEKETENEDRI
jgi:methionyl-tRNA synthetase